MISYYRIYYDQEIQNFSGLKQIYIHKPLPSYEITQAELAEFINSNEEDVSFKCEINRFIYAAVRYIPWKSETKLPIEQQALYDVFIYPTPMKNKTPLYVSPTSIKTVNSYIVKSKLDTSDPIAVTYAEKFLTPINSKWDGVEYHWKKDIFGAYNYRYAGGTGYYAYISISSPVYTYNNKISPDFNHLIINNVSLKNTLKTQKYINIHYSMNPLIRSTDSTTWNSMNNEEKIQFKSNFEDTTKFRSLDMVNPGKNSYLNYYLRIFQTINRLNNQTWRQSFEYPFDAINVLSGPGVYSSENMLLFIDSYLILYKNTYDFTFTNLLRKEDMSVLPYEYFGDTSYYSLFNKFHSYEYDTPLRLVDATNVSFAYQNTQTIPDGTVIGTLPQDSTTFQWKYIRDTSTTYWDDSANWTNITNKEFLFYNKQMNIQVERDNKFLPIQSRSYVVRDKSTTNTSATKKFWYVYTIRQLKKESIDLLLDNSFQMTSKWFVDNIELLNDITYDQHWFIYSFTYTTANVLTRTFYKHLSIIDQTMFSFSEDLTKYETNSCRIFYNYNESNDALKQNIVDSSDIITQTKLDVTNSGGNYILPIRRKQSRAYRIYDDTLAALKDFTCDSTYLVNRTYEYKVNNTLVDSTFPSSISDNYVEDLSYFCALDFMMNHLLSEEDGLIVNEVRTKGYTEFLFRDIVGNTYFYNYSNQKLTQRLAGWCSYWGVKTDDSITTVLADGAKYKWGHYLPSPTTHWDVQYPRYDKSTSKSQTWVYYRLGSGTTTSQSKTLIWDLEYYYDHYSGYYSNSSYYLFDATTQPHSDITKWSSPTALFYIAQTGKGAPTMEYYLRDQSYMDISTTTSIVGKYTYGYRRTSTDTSGNTPRKLEKSFSSGNWETQHEYSQELYNDSLEFFLKLTPYDIIIANYLDGTAVRILTNSGPNEKIDDTVLCEIDWIDSTTFFTKSFIVKRKLSRKYGVTIDSTFLATLANRWKCSIGWCNKMPRVNQLGSSNALAFTDSKSEKKGINAGRLFRIDNSTELFSVNLEYFTILGGSTASWGFSSSSLCNSVYSGQYPIHKDTPAIHMRCYDNTKYVLKQNALLELIYSYLVKNGNGYLLPKQDVTTIVYNVEDIIDRTNTLQNISKIMPMADSTVALSLYNDTLYFGDMTPVSNESINSDLTVSYTPTDSTLNYTKNYGKPVISIDNTSMIPSSDSSIVLSLGEFIDKTNFQHLDIIDFQSLVEDSKFFLKMNDHTVDLEVDFDDNTISILDSGIDSTTVYTNIVYLTNDKYIALFHRFDSSAYQSSTTLTPALYYTLKNYPDISSQTLQNCVYLNSSFRDYSFENNTYATSTDQSTRYTMYRIQVNVNNLVKKNDLTSTFKTPTNLFGDFTAYMIGTAAVCSPVMSRGEIIDHIFDTTLSRYFIVRVNLNWIMFDRSDLTRFQVAFVYNNVLTNVGTFDIDEIDRFISMKVQTTNQYFNYAQDVAGTVSQVDSFLDMVKIVSYNPTGNMYMIADYDDDALELVFTDILNNLD